LAVFFAARSSIQPRPIEEVPAPVIFGGAGEVLHSFAKIRRWRFCAPFADDRVCRVKQTAKAVSKAMSPARPCNSRNPFDADCFAYQRYLFKISSPRPATPAGAERNPIVRLARLTFIAQTNDALGKSSALRLNVPDDNRIHPPAAMRFHWTKAGVSATHRQSSSGRRRRITRRTGHAVAPKNPPKSSAHPEPVLLRWRAVKRVSDIST